MLGAIISLLTHNNKRMIKITQKKGSQIADFYREVFKGKR